MKTIRVTWLVMLILTFAFTLACSDDSDGGSNQPTEKKATFKVIGSGGATLSTIVYGVGTSTVPVNGLNSPSWTSQEITIPDGVTILSLAANAQGTSLSSSIKLQIFVNNQLKKEITANGTVMSTFTQYTLE